MMFLESSEFNLFSLWLDNVNLVGLNVFVQLSKKKLECLNFTLNKHAAKDSNDETCDFPQRKWNLYLNNNRNVNKWKLL